MLTLLILTNALAQNSLPPIVARRVDSCSYWRMVEGRNMGYAYGCSSLPRSVEVADAMSTERAILALEARVIELEKKAKDCSEMP